MDNSSFSQDSSGIQVAAASRPRGQAISGDNSLPVPDGTFPVHIIQGVPVVATPAEIDMTSAEALRAALLAAAASGRGTLVVDMSRTRFCDSAGLHTLIAAHNRAHAEGGQVRLVIPGAPILRVLAITGIDRVIPNFATVAEALARPAVTAKGRRQRTEGDARAEDQPVQPAPSR
jgi:anti-sigma B factor antagonist